MSYDEYRKKEHKVPYTYSIKSASNFLYYFGERHSFDPADGQWIELEKFWQDFLEQTKNLKRIVFVEGGKGPYEASKKESILKYGGMGLITYLAEQELVETYSPEPDRKYERSELEKQFSREQIQYYYFARLVYQWNRMQESKPAFEGYINNFLESDRKNSGWADFDFSLEAMKKIHADIFQRPFNETDRDFFYNVTNPVVLKTVINEVSRTSSDVRDKYIVQEIKRYIDEGYSIFIQFGFSHAVIQEPLLREILVNI